MRFKEIHLEGERKQLTIIKDAKMWKTPDEEKNRSDGILGKNLSLSNWSSSE